MVREQKVAVEMMKVVEFWINVMDKANSICWQVGYRYERKKQIRMFLAWAPEEWDNQLLRWRRL